MVHIFHFLPASLVFEIVNPFSWIFNAISSGKSCLISTWRQDTRIFPACWILIGQFKFPARQPYARWWSACGSSRRWSADILKNSKWRSLVIIHARARVKMMYIQILQKPWFYTTYTRVCQRNFIYLISILAKFVLFEYNHEVIVIKTI